jgi:cytoskeletal protein CcmA (bactofilin family)
MSTSALYSNLGVTSGSINAVEDQKAPATGAQVTSQIIDGTVAPPPGVTNFALAWVGTSLEATWSWTASDSANYAQYANIAFTVGGVTKVAQVLANSESKYDLTLTQNRAFFGQPATTGISVTITIIDIFGNSSVPSTLVAPPYATDLPVPVITVTSVKNGYQVAYTTPTQSDFIQISIEEVVSSASSDPNAGYNVVYTGKINPSVIITPDTSARWVRARFTDGLESYTNYSTAYKITPTSPVVINNTPPTEVTAVTAAWSGSSVVVSYTLPATTAAANVIVLLTAPNNQVGYFYSTPTSGTLTQTFTISDVELYAQFGSYFSSFTGLLKSASSVDVRSSGVAFTVAARSNPLSGITPTFSISPAANGYIVSWQDYTGATKADIYESSTPWASYPTDESSRVYTGLSPVTIQSLNYNTRYILIRLYDNYGDTSNYSALPGQSVVPYDPGLLSLISNPVAFQTGGSILAGTSATSNPKAIFNQTGIYVYDAAGNPTTEIIGNASGGANTFITTKAQIADWSISSTKIENTLSGSPSGGAGTYTGLSGTGAYAFWAGADTSGNTDGLAQFSVTPSGTVTAKNINIYGGTLSVGGSNFTVTSQGVLNAQSATIRGDITATSGTFSGNVLISSPGSLYSGTVIGQNISNGYILNTSGITFNNGTTNITTIDASTGLFTTNAANIGGWNINTASVPNAIYSQSSNGQILLDSSNALISVKDAAGSYYSSLSVPNANGYVFWAGAATNAASDVASANFRLDKTGKLYATGAVISGTITQNNYTLTAGTQDFASATGTYVPGATSYWLSPVLTVAQTTSFVIQDSTSGQPYGGSFGMYSGSSTGGATLSGKSNKGTLFAIDDANNNHILTGGKLDTQYHSDSSYNDVPTYLAISSSGVLTRGKALYYSGSSQSTITGSYGYVGQIGDLIFSVA